MQPFEQEIHINDYIRIIRSRKNVALTFFLVTVFVVTVGSFLMRPVYRATVSLLVDLESPNVLTASDTVALERPDYYAYKEYFQSQTEIIKSRSIISQVFEEFNLGKSKEYQRAKDPIESFLKIIKVEPVRDTRLLLLHVDNKNPKFAQDLANRIASVYVERNLSYITKSEAMNLLKNEYLKLQTKLSEYAKVYKDKHPKMIRLNQEIEQMVATIKKEQARMNIFDLSEAKSEASKLALAGLKVNNITIQDPATLPLMPQRPKKRLNILLAMIVGLFGGMGLAFFFEYLDDTVKNAEDIARLVEWPFLGNIPDMDSTSKSTELEKDIFVHTMPKDPISEAYRSIRTSVLFSSTEEHPLKSVTITSPGPQEGKTTSLCNLGIAIAQNKKQVLLVDADMRKPRLHEVFKKENKIGLSSFLCNQSKFEEVIQDTGIENISLVSGGPHPPDPSELISSHKLQEFISIAKKKFDFILFDTPPIAVVTDAAILSQFSDGVIMVVESGKTSRRALPRIQQVLNDAKARVIGIILNKISIMTTKDYYYYSHYYGKQLSAPP